MSMTLELVGMKVLTVRQPFADQIIFGGRFCENQPLPIFHRGSLLIHAAAKVRRPMAGCLLEKLDEGSRALYSSPGNGVLSAIIGVVEVVDCFHAEDWECALLYEPGDSDFEKPATPDQLRAREYIERNREKDLWLAIGKFVWIFDRPEPIEPVRCRGGTGVWTFEG